MVKRLPVLMYHRVGEAHNDWERKYCVSPKLFDAHMAALAKGGWQAVSLADFFAWLEDGRQLPELSFLLTFDDGFLGVFEHAAPVLRRLGWPATVFLVSGLTGQRDFWCAAQNPSGETYPLMDAGHIQALRDQGFSFQSHTRHHADLPTLDDESLRAELAGSRSDLSSLLGESVDYLAYPFGRFDDRVIAAAREAGYRAAFSTQPGFNRVDVDRFRLRRLDVFGTDTANALLNKIRLGTNDGSLRNAIQYRVNRVFARFGLTGDSPQR
jgi:peptidoglycan/xylan/chitin deacetylase (PgdA/CDA1 family)